MHTCVHYTPLALKDTLSGPHEERLIEDIFSKRRYNRLARPVAQEEDSLKVKFGLNLQQIIEVDEKNEMLHTNMWLNYEWQDYKLSWNETEYGGVQNIRLPHNMVWTPDILLYNSADEDIDSKFPVNVIVNSDGTLSWVPLGLYISSCAIDIRWFPFDDQHCDMKFGSWTYDGNKINLTLLMDVIDLSTYQVSGEWDLIDAPAERHVIMYTCCPEPYIDVTFKMHIRRRTLYYGFNLIIPVALISSLTLVTFFLPPDAGEKISLGITILLSLSVFSLIVAESVPSTSLAVPLIGITILLSLSVFSLIVADSVPSTSLATPIVGIYFSTIMLMCALSVVMTVVVLNFHHRNPDMCHMPILIRRLICEWLAWVLRMSRPGKDLSRQFLLRKQRIRELEKRTPPSVSLISNVKDVDNAIPLNDFPPLRSIRMDDGGVLNVKNELLAILNELRFITHKIKEDADNADEINDWKFAAMVIDRLCVWIFTISMITTTAAVLISAPHIVS